MVLDTFLLNTQQYKVCIKGKVEQSRERSSALSLHLNIVAIEKGAFWSPSTTVSYFTFTFSVVMVTAIGNGHGDSSSNPEQVVCISHKANTLGKGMNPTILLPA